MPKRRTRQTEENPTVAPPQDALPESPPIEDAQPVTSPKRIRELTITAQQFVTARSYRWEQTAGFLRWSAQRHGGKARKTIAEWAPLWEAFWNEPVR